MPLAERDRAAMREAIDAMRREGGADAEWIEGKLAERGFEEAGHAASYHCQYAALRLKPWEFAPCWVAPDEVDAIIAAGEDRKRYGAAKLARRMLDAGASLFAPDPERALREARRRPAA
jgi:hypothetical protein